MGLVKHVVLPLLGTFHAFGACLLLFNKDAVAEINQWPDFDQPRTPIERHLMGAAGSNHVLCLTNCIVGIFFEDSHYRTIALVLEMIFYGGAAIDAKREDLPPFIPLTFFVIAAVGSLVHAFEPGLFTKDKTKTKSG